MKLRLSILAAMVTFLSLAAFANHNADLKSAAEYEREDAILGFIGFDREDLESFEGLFDRDDHRHDRGRGDRDRGRDDHRHDRGRGDRGGYVCFAENLRGQVFRGLDDSARRAQNEAMRSCERVSRRCDRLGCRRR